MGSKVKKVPSTMQVDTERDSKRIVMHHALRQLANAAGVHGSTGKAERRSRRRAGKAVARKTHEED